MAETQEPDMVPVGRGKQRERAERILEAAAQLMLRWGYKRVTIDDIARQTEIGSGTIYLHWKTRDALFETLMWREAVTLWRELQRRLLADPEEVLLHRMMRSMLIVVMGRPLARALFTGDSELLGKLAQGQIARQTRNIVPSKDFMQMWRDLGLLRSDMDLAVQTYAFSATVTGFCLIDPLLIEEEQVALEARGDALAHTIRLAFEPDTLPPLDILREKVVPHMVQLLEQICAYCEQEMQKRMV